MTMAPTALSLLGVENTRRRKHTAPANGIPFAAGIMQITTESRPIRSSRKPTSYYNSFQTICSSASDNPPSYAVAARHRQSQRNHRDVGRETLPDYTCTIATEAKVLLYLESTNPLHSVSGSEWREVYAVLRGTLLSFHRVKDNRPGKLLKSYTLQHAEIGLAADTEHDVLVPQSRLAHLIPSAARWKAWQRDPDLFRCVRQHILRLRVETDQMLLADAAEECIHSLIQAIGTGIDISHAIDERSIPRQCTVPRRRRRRAMLGGDLNDPTLLAEQERILRDMYPAFAERNVHLRPVMGRTVTSTSEFRPGEEEELDVAIMREDYTDPAAARPTTSRQTTSSSLSPSPTAGALYTTSAANFTVAGKWQPPHTRSLQQTQRYVRRCLPILLADSVRASDVLVWNGKRMKINWRMQILEEWELQPPSYKSHAFSTGLDSEQARSISQCSAAGSGPQDNLRTSMSDLGAEPDDQITRAEDALANLTLDKVTSLEAIDKATVDGSEAGCHGEQPGHPGSNMSGLVFCF